ALRRGAVACPRQPGDRRQGADRGHRRVHGHLLVGGVQWLLAAEDLPHLTSREPAPPGSLHPPQNALCSARLAARGGREQAKMISIRKERPPDVAAREALLDEAFGKRRWLKSSQRLRDGRRPADDLAFVAADGKQVVGTARCWDIVCGTGQTALLLGPVAVASDCRNRGIGSALVRHALSAARPRGPRAGILVGGAA